MVKTKTAKSVKKTDCQEALRLANALLKKLSKQDEWTKAEEKQLKKLKEIVSVLSKLLPLFDKHESEVVEISNKKDAEIINRFMKRREAHENN